MKNNTLPLTSMDIVLSALMLVFAASIVVFGYRKDYRDNPQLFFKTLLGVPATALLHFTGLNCLYKRIEQMVLRLVRKRS